MFRKAVATLLTAAMALSIAGCDPFGVRKQMGIIDQVITEYVKALQELDEEKVMELTVFDESDPEYKDIKDCFVFDGNADYIRDVYLTTASTITVNANTNNTHFDGDDKASIDFDYTIVDWKPLFESSSKNPEELVKAIKNCNDYNTVKGGLEFKKVGGEWHISKIKNIDKLLAFIKVMPNLESTEGPALPPDSTENTDNTDPVYPTETTQFPDSYDKAIDAYIQLLEKNKSAIKQVEKDFEIYTIGIFDINDDGLPELCFMTSAGGTASMSSLYVYTYNEYAGEAVKVIEVPNVIYMAADGGYFLMYKTSDRIIVTHAGGSEVKFRYWTDIYDFQWNLISSYRRDVLTDISDDGETVTFEYFENNVEITEKQYNKVFKTDVANTVVILAKNYTPGPDDVEYPLSGKPYYLPFGYESAITYLKSLKS